MAGNTQPDYAAFLAAKSQIGQSHGFAPTFLPDFLYDFQREIVDWAVRGGRRAIFADCGLGKTPMQLVWAQNVAEHTNKPVLIATPLAVSYQLVEEGAKFDIPVVRSVDGTVPNGAGIVATNYERLSHFSPSTFSGMVCDESSILKNFNGARKSEITEFMRTLKYRLLCTATAAPNDYIELGTSSEALGEMGYQDMLSRFFRNKQRTGNERARMFGKATEWRFKGHAEEHFWRWVSSWARAIRRPSDYGYGDDGFVLPPLTEVDHVVEARILADGCLFSMPAVTLQEQREERRRTLVERCERVAEETKETAQSLVWCHLNDEGDLLADMIDGALQVKGADTDEAKEERLMAFAHGDTRVLVTKPKIGAWGLNLQGCSHVTFFPSHSYEQYYQGVRRCWRFGQKRPVRVDVVLTEGEKLVLANLRQKSVKADRMFDGLMRHMNDALTIARADHSEFTRQTEVPSWL